MRRLGFVCSLALVFAATSAAQELNLPPRGEAVETVEAEPLRAVVPADNANEQEPNESAGNATPLSVPSSNNGSASVGDATGVNINYGGGVTDGVEDLWMINLTQPMRLRIDLTWSNSSADLDLFVLTINGSTVSGVAESNIIGAAPEGITTATLNPGTYYVGVSAWSGGSPYELKVAQATTSTACVSNTTTICLAEGRFRARATWNTNDQNGTAGAVQLTPDSGYFWFFGNANVELVVKVLNACTFNNRFWVFAGALTDVGVTLTVTDTQTGSSKDYNNPRGNAFAPIQDTNAFATCNAISCSYGVSPTSNTFAASGGSGTVSISTTSGCTWNASSNASWLSFSGATSGSGSGSVNYVVAANPSSSPRTGTMTIGGQTVTITQNGQASSCTYGLSPTSNSFASNGGGGAVTINTSAGCAWSATSNDSWLTITGPNSGSGPASVSYVVAANASTNARTGTMTIAGQTFTVTQSGQTPVTNYNGTWTGQTSQARAITINVANNAITSVSFGWAASGSCSVTGDTTTTFNPPRAINGNSFSLSGSGPFSFTINGSFSSSNAGSGNMTFSFSQPFPPCNASGNATFTINK